MAAFTDAEETSLPLYQTQEYQLPTDAKLKLFDCDLSSVSEVKSCLEGGALPMFFREGVSAVHLACSLNALDSVKLLLDTYHTNGSAAHAIAARTDATQETPLLMACSAGSLEVVHYLLELGAVATDQNSYGNTALHLACGAPKNAGAMVHLLIKAGANVVSTNKLGAHPLHFAPFALPESEAVSVYGALVEHGADINARDQRGDTPLHVAVTKKSPSLIAGLLHLGADPKIKDNNHLSPIDLAETYTSGTQLEDLKVLLEKHK